MSALLAGLALLPGLGHTQEADQTVLPPAVSKSYPVYPAISRRLGEQGRVMIRLRIEADGSVSQAGVQQSSGFERLDAAALQAAQAWHFMPYLQNGEPAARWYRVPVVFNLSDGAASTPASPPAAAPVRSDALMRAVAVASASAPAPAPAAAAPVPPAMPAYGTTAAPARGPSAGWAGVVGAAIRRNLVNPPGLPGNPRAEISLTLAPDGTITGRSLSQSSGVPDWDAAALQAIDRTVALPPDRDGRVPSRLVIGLRPYDTTAATAAAPTPVPVPMPVQASTPTPTIAAQPASAPMSMPQSMPVPMPASVPSPLPDDCPPASVDAATAPAQLGELLWRCSASPVPYEAALQRVLARTPPAAVHLPPQPRTRPGGPLQTRALAFDLFFYLGDISLLDPATHAFENLVGRLGDMASIQSVQITARTDRAEDATGSGDLLARYRALQAQQYLRSAGLSDSVPVTVVRAHAQLADTPAGRARDRSVAVKVLGTMAVAE